MNVRWLTRCSLLALGLAMVVGFYGCPGSPTVCASDADCSGATPVCKDGTCAAKDSKPGGCSSDADCGDKKVCDTNAGKSGACFDKCAADADCGPGNTCDTTLGRCTCKQADCEGRDGGGKYGCHPVLYICEAFCSGDGDCGDSNKCRGNDGKKHCLNPDEVKVCAADADCKTGEKCDTSAKDAKCVAVSTGCKADADCTGKPEGEKCDDTTGKCVQCLLDEDCTGTGEKCSLEGKCQGPTSCADSKSCYDADTDKSSYCPKPGESQCTKATLSCDATKKASGNDAWTAGIKNGEGSIIWGVTAKLLTDGTSCSSFPSGAKPCTVGNGDCTGQDEICGGHFGGTKGKCVAGCKTDGDCDNGKCNMDGGDLKGTGACLIADQKGTVEVKFSFYHPSGKFKSGDDKPKHSIVKLYDDRGIATKVSIESGDKTTGTAAFSYCDTKAKNGESHAFFVRDEDSKPSNLGCYTPAE